MFFDYHILWELIRETIYLFLADNKAKNKHTIAGASILKVKGSTLHKNPKYSNIKPSEPSFKVSRYYFKLLSDNFEINSVDSLYLLNL